MAEKSKFTPYQELAKDVAMGLKPAEVKNNIDAITLNAAQELQEQGKGKGNPNFIEEHQKTIRDYYAEKATLVGGNEYIVRAADQSRNDIAARKKNAHQERLDSDPDYAERIKKAGAQLAQAIKIEGEAGQLPPKATRDISKGEGR